MLRLASDENFDGTIVRGLLRRRPELDLVRVQDVELSGIDDPAILAWAAQEDRVLLTQDVATITKYAYERVRDGVAMPGVIEVSQNAPINQVIEDILLLIDCSEATDLDGLILYLHFITIRSLPWDDLSLAL